MNLFLKAKHWQLFLATFGIPFLLQMIVMVNVFTTAFHGQDPSATMSLFKYYALIMILFIGALLGWQWSVAIGLQKLLPAGITMKVKKFKVAFFIPAIYMAALIPLFFFVFADSFWGNQPPGPMFVVVSIVIFPLHMFCMLCLFYTVYFVAKTIKTVELQRHVSFSEFAGEFFLVWFFPIGVWILQPRINSLAAKEDESITEL